MVRSHAFNTFKDIVEQQYINVKHSPIALDYIQKAGHPTKLRTTVYFSGCPNISSYAEKLKNKIKKMKTFYRTQHQHCPSEKDEERSVSPVVVKRRTRKVPDHTHSNVKI